MDLKKEINNPKIISILRKSKDIFMFLLLLLFIMQPILKELKFTFNLSSTYEFGIVIIIGMFGVFFFGFYGIMNYKQSENKKIYLKEMLPIFILMLFMGWTLISCIFSPNRKLAFWGNDYRNEGYLTYIAYAGIFALSFYLTSNKLKLTLFKIIVIISVLLSLALLSVSNIRNSAIFFCSNTMNTGVFHQFNHYGYYLMISTIIANFLFVTENRKLQKAFYLIAYSYLLCFLIYNDTFGCYLALLATLIIFLIYSIIKKYKIYLPIISLIIFIILTFTVQINGKNPALTNLKTFFGDIHKVSSTFTENPEEDWQKAGTGRMELWVNGLKFFTERPILGYGPENLESKFEAVHINQDRPHNLIIQLLTTSGFIGCLLYLLAIGIIVIRSFKVLNSENKIHFISHFVMIGYLISAMFGNSMYYTSPYFFIMLGLVFCETIHEYQKVNDKKK